MTTDNKTLADVQPGGMVRDQLPPLPRTHYNACGDGSEPLYTSEQMRDYASAALSAQPSPGGQGDVVQCGKCKGRGYVDVDVDVDESGSSIGNIEACPHCALAAPPAQAVDLANVIDQIAQQWDGCSYDAVGETIDVGQAIRATGKRLIDSQAVDNG
ncbi:hypothetical protein DKY64_04745 [Stenotrophomonas maltophilia]|nr:hypothetical protein DKY64_04745 [Stenotrophomonas maltophilia]